MQIRIPVKLPIANIFNTASRGLAVTAISGYQKFISPHKGFSCAHRVLYGCESCSQYFKQVIAEEGIITAIANAKGRFQECREANEILKERRAKCRKCRPRRKYYASRLTSNTIPNTMAIESGESSDVENPDIDSDPQDSPESNNPETQRLGGSQWGKKRRSQAGNSDNGDCCGDGITDTCDCLGDSIDNCNNPLEGVSCPDLSCPDLSCPDLGCGNADCLSGMDCSGLDCGGLDCSGCGDCGSCG
jgi:putative component of membrane protein insertase Oxa1/YidC/SpoIIIJ protein YidD